MLMSVRVYVGLYGLVCCVFVLLCVLTLENLKQTFTNARQMKIKKNSILFRMGGGGFKGYCKEIVLTTLLNLI